MENDNLKSFIRECDRACAVLGIARMTLSKRILGSGIRLDQLASGRSDVSIRVLERARRRLADMLSLEDAA